MQAIWLSWKTWIHADNGSHCWPGFLGRCHSGRCDFIRWLWLIWSSNWGSLDFVITNPGHYVVMEARDSGATRQTDTATLLVEPVGA